MLTRIPKSASRKRRWQALILWALAAIGGLVILPEIAQANSYGSWNYHTTHRYYYRYYRYRPSPDAESLKYHYNIYFPSRPRHIYYFDPQNKVYWGRYDLQQEGFSELPSNQRNPQLLEIPESAYPPPGQMPYVPETEGEERILRPRRGNLPSRRPSPSPAPPRGSGFRGSGARGSGSR